MEVLGNLFTPVGVSREIQRTVFTIVEGFVKMWHGIFSARKDLEGIFHRYGGPVKLTLSVRKTMEKNFHNYRCAVKLMPASLGDRKDVESTGHRFKDLHNGEKCYLDLTGHSNWREQASQDLQSGEQFFLPLS